jgi:hypothetical protein
MIGIERPAGGITAKRSERRAAGGPARMVEAGRLLVVMDLAVCREIAGIQRWATFAAAQNVVDVRRGGSAAWDRANRISPEERGTERLPLRGAVERISRQSDSLAKMAELLRIFMG